MSWLSCTIHQSTHTHDFHMVWQMLTTFTHWIIISKNFSENWAIINQYTTILVFMTIAVLKTILMNKQIHDCFKNSVSTLADISRDRNSDAYTFKDDFVLKTSSNWRYKETHTHITARCYSTFVTHYLYSMVFLFLGLSWCSEIFGDSN